jgi:hypothetical protein
MPVAAMFAIVSWMGIAMTIADGLNPDAPRQYRDGHQQNGEFK